MAHLWTRGDEELGRLGLTRRAARNCAREWIDAGDSGELLADDVPVFVSGIFCDRGTHVTWFQATDAFDEHALHITRRVREFVRDYPQRPVLFSTLVHPAARRWFRAIGFEGDNWRGQTAIGFPLYRFVRR
jgi:hypothetical protein